MRNEGRTIKTGEQPLKMVKVRAGTVNKLRELEVLKEAGVKDEGNSGEVMQGLYARSQTEPYIPDPVVDVSFFVDMARSAGVTLLCSGNHTEK
jgi:xeroderma pigmentosum group C-complementing protein